MVGESFHPRGCWGEDSDHIRLGATVQKLLRLFAFMLPRHTPTDCVLTDCWLWNSVLRIADWSTSADNLRNPHSEIRKSQSINCFIGFTKSKATRASLDLSKLCARELKLFSESPWQDRWSYLIQRGLRDHVNCALWRKHSNVNELDT